MDTLKVVCGVVVLVAGAALAVGNAALAVCKVRNEWYKGSVAEQRAARQPAGG